MREVFRMTFGGLSVQYYLRQLFFSFLILALMAWIAIRNPHPVQPSLIIFFAVCALLYPYSRFVYEQVVGFVMGNNLFFANAFLVLFLKAITMVLCWMFAILIAPFGLLYLYFHHRKAQA